jgi:putative hydrolase of the HAD superfamily
MATTRNIQAVTFDVGGTLIAPHPSVGARYAQAALGHDGTSIPATILDQRFREIWGRQQPFQHSRDNWAKLVDEVFDELVKVPPSQSFFPGLYAEFATASAWRTFEDVIPTFEALAGEGLDLGIISNWDERLRPLLRELRLDRYFDCVVISCEAGFTKPSRVVFEEALRQLGRPADEVLHVGDGFREDYTGARDAGFHALHLYRDAPASDHQLRSLSELPHRLAALGDLPGPNFLTPRD